MAYATVADLEARWKALESGQASVAEALLDGVAVLIDSYGTPDEDAALTVSCTAVRRAMSVNDMGLYGVTQSSMTAGSYQQQWTYGNPTGDLYLTKAERRMLGFGGGKAGIARPSSGRLEPDDD